MEKVKLGKKGGFDIEDIPALILWVTAIILFLTVLDMGGCKKHYSEATIGSEKENTVSATRILLNYLNNELDYDNKKVKVKDLISELYTTQDTSEKDEIQKLIIEKTKENLGKEVCWTLRVIAKPGIRIEGAKCKEIMETALFSELTGYVKITASIPHSTRKLDVEYQEYVLTPIAGGAP